MNPGCSARRCLLEACRHLHDLTTLLGGRFDSQVFWALSVTDSNLGLSFHSLVPCLNYVLIAQGESPGRFLMPRVSEFFHQQMLQGSTEPGILTPLSPQGMTSLKSSLKTMFKDEMPSDG